MGDSVHSRHDRRVAQRRALGHGLLGALPLALTVSLAVASVSLHWVAEDFSLVYYPAAHRLLEGGNPYAVSDAQIVNGAAFVYPPLAAVILAPLTLAPSGLADHLYVLICLALVPGTLWVAGVRDWRVYGVVLLWYPVIVGWQGENVSVPAMFLVALTWRHRDRPLLAGTVVAVAVSLKPFLWPLALWLVVTRRWAAAGWALAGALALNLLAWALVGFDEISRFLRLSSEDLKARWLGGYGLPAIAGRVGFGPGAADALLVCVAAVMALVMLNQGLRRSREPQALVLCVVLMLVASPVVWIHYFVLLLVPLAISRPRFDAAWIVPIVMWLLPPATSVGGWQLALAWAVVALCAAAALRAHPSVRLPDDRRPRRDRVAGLVSTG